MGAGGGIIFAQETVATDAADDAHLFEAHSAVFGNELHGDDDGNKGKHAADDKGGKKLMRIEGCQGNGHKAGRVAGCGVCCAGGGSSSSSAYLPGR